MTDQFKHWQYQVDEDGIYWLTLDKSDSNVNLLSSEVIIELDSLLDDIESDKCKGLVIQSGKKDSFIFGADVNEFTTLNNEDEALAFLERGHALMNKIEALPYPTVSLIHGMCLGGGTELSLACRYRIASSESITKIGLPEIKLGIHPGYGGTERSIRRTGPLPAMDLMLTGRTLPAYTAKKIGLVDDAVPERQLIHAAKYFVLNKPPVTRPKLLQRLANHRILRPIIAGQMRKQVSRKAKKAHYPAPYALIDLWVKYADRPEIMLQQEARSVAELALTKTAANLLRVYFLQDKLKSQGKKVDFNPSHVHVIGGGVMGGDIAAWCAIQGYRVTVQDQDPGRLAQTYKRAHTSFKKKFKRDKRAIIAASDRFITDSKGIGIEHADIIIEAIFENADVKRQLYTDIEPRIKDDAILATNTSSIKLEDLASALKKPERLVGLHFFNPVALMPLIEIISGDNTDKEIAKKTMAFAKNISKLPLSVKSSPGFLVNRILMPYLLEAVTMISEGIPAECIDRAALDYGMPMGPIELADTVGLDICLSVADILSKALNTELPDTLDNLVSKKRLGKKTGEGFYTYKKGKAVKNKNASYSNIQNVQDRLVYRLLNEACACLRENIVDDAEAVDAGVIFGTGFAPFTGGPLNYIKEVGTDEITSRMKELHSTYGDRFTLDNGCSSLK